MYVVKNLTELVNGVKMHQKQAYGTKITLQLGEEYFTEPAKRYYAFVEKIVSDFQEKQYYEQRSLHSSWRDGTMSRKSTN